MAIRPRPRRLHLRMKGCERHEPTPESKATFAPAPNRSANAGTCVRPVPRAIASRRTNHPPHDGSLCTDRGPATPTRPDPTHQTVVSPYASNKTSPQTKADRNANHTKSPTWTASPTRLISLPVLRCCHFSHPGMQPSPTYFAGSTYLNLLGWLGFPPPAPASRPPADSSGPAPASTRTTVVRRTQHRLPANTATDHSRSPQLLQHPARAANQLGLGTITLHRQQLAGRPKQWQAQLPATPGNGKTASRRHDRQKSDPCRRQRWLDLG